MATKYTEVTTTGPVEWSKIFENNRDMTGYEGAYVPFEGAYTLQQIQTSILQVSLTTYRAH